MVRASVWYALEDNNPLILKISYEWRVPRRAALSDVC